MARTPTPDPGAPVAAPARTPAQRAAHARGVAAEGQAARLLEARGFAILERRARTGAGEIDLIARRGDLLVFCEVKRRASLAAAAESLQVRQQRRIAAAAAAWLADRPELAALQMRFDAILIAGTAAEHLPAAFEAEPG
ncbi:YraN family protein [Xanthobacter sp. V4C-4]|uniref:YraN family protein n=1 Tax=Xanthobacter cornucopiae TaxID=3119924 RepID=UPI003726C71B